MRLSFLLLFSIFSFSCNFNSTSSDKIIEPGGYPYGDLFINIFGDGKLIVCRNSDITSSLGTWNQRVENPFSELRFQFIEQTKYSDKGKTDSVVLAIDSSEIWSVRKSEFGFHRFVHISGNTYEDHVLLRDYGPSTVCNFN